MNFNGIGVMQQEGSGESIRTKSGVKFSQIEYEEKVRKVNPYIEIISDYKGVEEEITYKCLECKEEKTIKRARTLYTKKIKCNERKIKEAHDEYVEKVREKNPGIEVISVYTGIIEPVTYRCLCCGDIETKRNAQSLYTNKIKCKKEEDEELQKNYIKRVKQVNPHIKITGQYEGSEKPITYTCLL